MLCVPKADVAAATVMVTAREDTGALGTGTAATVAGYIDNAQAIQNGAFGGLGSVLVKIDLFMNVVDQAASVRGSDCL